MPNIGPVCTVVLFAFQRVVHRFGEYYFQHIYPGSKGQAEKSQAEKGQAKEEQEEQDDWAPQEGKKRQGQDNYEREKEVMPRGSLSWSPALVVVAVLTMFVTPASASFGFQEGSFENSIFNENGSPDTQAGSHPFELTTGFRFTTKVGLNGGLVPDGNAKDIEVDLPAGLVGNPAATPKCTQEQFYTPSRGLALLYLEGQLIRTGYSEASCPDNSQVGIARVELNLSEEKEGGAAFYFGIYNLVAPPGVPALFGIHPIGVPIVLSPKIRTGKDYGITVVSKNVSEGERVFGVTTDFWGVPSDTSHDGWRGECLSVNGISLAGILGHSCSTEMKGAPLLTLPTSCSADPLGTMIRADSWQNPVQSVELEGVVAAAVDHDSQGRPIGIVGCERLGFSPTINVQAGTTAAASPTGPSVRLRIPQNETPNGLAEADLRKAVVTLPTGASISPSAANQLQSCTESEIALNSAGPSSCPNASKAGTVEITTPLLETPLTGSVYVATPYENKFGTLLALYVVAEGAGVVIKLAGEVRADPITGQLTTVFEEAPQQPFSELRLSLFGGPRAVLMTPRTCGTYQTTGLLTPWSGETSTAFATLPAEFELNTNCGSGFSPSIVAGTVSNQAGGFSPFTFRLTRSDSDENFSRLSLTTPPGLLGMLSKVTLCGEPQAAQGTCPASSQIGHVTVGAGPGSDQVFVPQPGKPQDPVYLTGPYEGQPFGLSIVVPAEAGPFNLGEPSGSGFKPIVVRSAIGVNPHTARLTIVSDPFPTILQGIPIDVKTVDVTIDREGFIFNPTSCNPLSSDATVVSTQNAIASLSSRFQASDCASLGFGPKFGASTQAKASRSNGASLDVKIGYPPGPQANIASVKVALPIQLPSRLTTIQKACPEATFAANPATCPVASNIGTATVTTPVLSTPVAGPVYLVSHGGAAFPNVVMILQGQGVTLELVGDINIAKGITTSTFATVPDAPISTFELKLPTGPHSALTSNLPAKAKLSFCHTPLTMPTVINAQNGARITQSTRISVTGCPKAKKRAKGARARRK
jgi:hypothetical protein